MYHRVDDFLDDWTYESDATIKVFAEIDDSSLFQRIMPEGRSLGDLAWHLVVTIGEMLGRAGLSPDAPDEDAPMPPQARDFLVVYRRTALSAAAEVRSNWLDQDLATSVEMYGEQWTRGKVLSVMSLHQAHHRGQMTVLMRQAGLIVPGVYGPAREEWVRMGAAPPK